MSERVLAWTFDPERFHSWLIPRVVRGSSLDVAALLTTAKDIVSDPDDVVDAYLRALRFFRDDSELWESIFTTDPDVNETDEHYAIAMGRHLRSTTEISWWSHRIALAALEPVGWGGDPSLLMHGRTLATLAAESENSVLAEALAGARPSLGGWLSVDDARFLLESLLDAKARASMADPSPWFQGTMFETLTPPELAERVSLALSEFSTVLKTAVDRGEALRVVLWS
jgi:hypothetical protein